MTHPQSAWRRGDYHYSSWWSLWANLRVTIIHNTRLTETLGQLTLCDGLPVRVSLGECLHRLACGCVCVCVHEINVSQSKCGCARMCATTTTTTTPERASMAGWCIRWHVNYSAFKRGLSCGRREWRTEGCVVVGEVAHGEKTGRWRAHVDV